MELEQLVSKINADVGFWVWPVGALVLAGLFVLALWMGAALANIERVHIVNSLYLAPIQMAIVLAVGVVFFQQVIGSDVTTWAAWHNLLLGGGVVLAIDLALVVGLLVVLGLSDPLSSVYLWLARVPILSLLGALVAGLVFVGMAVVQGMDEPGGLEWIVWIGLGFAAVMILGAAMFFATRMGETTPGGPRRAAP